MSFVLVGLGILATQCFYFLGCVSSTSDQFAVTFFVVSVSTQCLHLILRVLLFLSFSACSLTACTMVLALSNLFFMVQTLDARSCCYCYHKLLLSEHWRCEECKALQGFQKCKLPQVVQQFRLSSGNKVHGDLLFKQYEHDYTALFMTGISAVSKE